jgi:hypothetical protein
MTGTTMGIGTDMRQSPGAAYAASGRPQHPGSVPIEQGT